LPSFSCGGSSVRFVTDEPNPYGLMSRLRLRRGVRSPTIVAADEIFEIPRRPHERGTGLRKESSLRQRTMRRTLNPQMVEPSLKRSDRNGTTISADQPPSKSAVRMVHTGFQLLFGCSLVTTQSNMPPSELEETPKPLRWS
jgi:hypothetical protein